MLEVRRLVELGVGEPAHLAVLPLPDQRLLALVVVYVYIRMLLEVHKEVIQESIKEVLNRYY